MRIILIAGAALAVAACGGGDKAETNTSTTNSMTANTMTTDPMSMNQTIPMDQNGSMGGMTNMGGNMGVGMGAGSNTQNMMMKDMETNDPDTNLANGM